MLAVFYTTVSDMLVSFTDWSTIQLFQMLINTALQQFFIGHPVVICLLTVFMQRHYFIGEISQQHTRANKIQLMQCISEPGGCSCCTLYTGWELRPSVLTDIATSSATFLVTWLPVFKDTMNRPALLFSFGYSGTVSWPVLHGLASFTITSTEKSAPDASWQFML